MKVMMSVAEATGTRFCREPGCPSDTVGHSRGLGAAYCDYHMRERLRANAKPRSAHEEEAVAKANGTAVPDEQQRAPAAPVDLRRSERPAGATPAPPKATPAPSAPVAAGARTEPSRAKRVKVRPPDRLADQSGRLVAFARRVDAARTKAMALEAQAESARLACNDLEREFRAAGLAMLDGVAPPDHAILGGP